MSRSWTIPSLEEYSYRKPPSIWWSVLAVVVIQVAGVIITVLTWEQGKPVVSSSFFLRALLLPFLFSCAVCSVIYADYENALDYADWWNSLCRTERAAWRQWAQAHVVIVNSVALTPEPELAERLLGLEGSAPMNPGKIQALPTTVHAADASRLEMTLEQLITPLMASMSHFAGRRSFEIVLQSDEQQDLTELRALWRKLNLPDFVQFRWVPSGAENTDIQTWFDARWPCDFRLVLGCQLHAEGKAPSCSEVAVAMLLTTPRVFNDFKNTFRPQARLFRPIVMPSDRVEDAVETLLTAEQTPRKRIRHAWLSDLPREGRHATLGALKEAGLGLPAHDVDHAIGKPGPVNGLLLQALAAQMVAYGQGAQLVASPAAREVSLNLVATQLAPLPEVEAGYGRVFRISYSVGVTCCLTVMMIGADALNASAGWRWGCLAVLVFLLALQIPVQIALRRMQAGDFVQALWRLAARHERA